jgi:hypothetical protein
VNVFEHLKNKFDVACEANVVSFDYVSFLFYDILCLILSFNSTIMIILLFTYNVVLCACMHDNLNRYGFMMFANICL